MGIVKAILKLLFLALSAVVLYFLYQFYITYHDNGIVVVTSQGPTVERLKKLAQLVTLNVSVADVLVGEGKGCRGSWLIKGDALIGIDLNNAEIVSKNDETKQATIRLPRPRVIQARVDHGRTRTWNVARLHWYTIGWDSDALRDAVMKQAQELVQHAAENESNLLQAQIHAEEIIKSFYSEVGWSVTVKWQDPSSQPAASQ